MQNMDIRIEGYDEYVKDFEGLRNNPDVLPKTEEEIMEFVKEACESRGVVDVEELEEFTHGLEQDYSIDGKEHEFRFVFEADDDGQVVMRYEPEE